jgi:hypothetical protein
MNYNDPTSIIYLRPYSVTFGSGENDAVFAGWYQSYLSVGDSIYFSVLNWANDYVEQGEYGDIAEEFLKWIRETNNPEVSFTDTVLGAFKDSQEDKERYARASDL